MISHLRHDGADILLEHHSLCDIASALRHGINLVLGNSTDEDDEHALTRHVDL